MPPDYSRRLVFVFGEESVRLPPRGSDRGGPPTKLGPNAAGVSLLLYWQWGGVPLAGWP